MTTTVQDKAKLIVIQTDKGKVRCSQFDTHLEGLGIPYAAPPVGDLRLRAPIEHAAWTDVRDATKFGPASLQTKTEYDEAQGSEDCLYLNVYSPAAAKDSAPIPVMVWHRRVCKRLWKRVLRRLPRTDCECRRGHRELSAWAFGLARTAVACSRGAGPFDR